MRVLIQRVSEAAVSIGGEEHARIGAGMLLLVGIEESDGGTDGTGNDEDIAWLTGKIARLRIFDGRNADGGLCGENIHPESLQASGEALVISQFTLHASTRKGNRPSYIRAARPEVAEPLYRKFVSRLSLELGGKPVATGVFGADMQVSLTNDGPVTIILDSQ